MTSLTLIPASEYSGLGNTVQPGHFSLFTAKVSVPSELQNYIYPQEQDFYGVLVAASNSSQNPPMVGGLTVASDCVVYGIRTIRYDESDKDGPHANVDSVLLFPTTGGQNFRASYQDDRVHFTPLSNDTGLAGVLTKIGAPQVSSGKLSDLSSDSAWVDLSTGRTNDG